MRRDHLGKNSNWLGSPYAVLGLCLFTLYSVLSLALLVSVTGQWLRGIPVWMLVQNHGILETAEYVILLLPVLQYAYWALRGLPAIITSLRYL